MSTDSDKKIDRAEGELNSALEDWEDQSIEPSLAEDATNDQTGMGSASAAKPASPTVPPGDTADRPAERTAPPCPATLPPADGRMADDLQPESDGSPCPTESPSKSERLAGLTRDTMPTVPADERPLPNWKIDLGYGCLPSVGRSPDADPTALPRSASVSEKHPVALASSEDDVLPRGSNSGPRSQANAQPNGDGEF